MNTLLSNAQKHYYDDGVSEDTLPLGVRYNSKTNKYCATIMFVGNDKTIQLSNWDTKEEAFAEYKLMKEADIKRVAAEYKGKIPEYIYKKLLTVEVMPYEMPIEKIRIGC